MRFRTKLLLFYGFFALVSALIAGIMYYEYSMNQHKKTEYANLEALSFQLSQQLDESVKPMQAVSNYILSDMDVLDALRTLSLPERSGSALRIMRENAKNTIQAKLSTYYIMDNFYRVLVFNAFGTAIASRDYSEYVIERNKSLDSIPWMEKVVGTRGKHVMIGCHPDDWGVERVETVFSVVKELQGKDLGYIEVQKEAGILDDLFSVAKDEISVMVVMDDGEVMYATPGRSASAAYAQIALENRGKIVETTVDGSGIVAATHYSTVTESTVMVLEDMWAISRQSAYILPATLLIAFLYFCVFFLCILALTNKLTKPVSELTKIMERTRLDNMKDIVPVETDADEIKALGIAYRRLMLQLDDAIIQERRLSNLQLQAQMDLLQAQVNPHFLYNVLNVITNRATIVGDEVICNMCDCLSQMLRYSTDVTSKYASVAEEIEYLRKYFYLMKCRYDYKLEYTISMHPMLKQTIMPKLVLQQLAENAILHGYDETSDIMRISIQGELENDVCTLRVCDNGNGFREEVMQNLMKRMMEVRKDLFENRETQKMGFGGMGIINTYARLVILYGERLDFDIRTGKNGTSINISFPSRKEE